MAKALATSPSRSRWLCHGASGSGSSSSCASSSATSKPRLPSAASVPAAPPNCSTRASSRNRFSRCARARQRRRIAGGFQPERHRQSLLQPGARHRRRLAMLDRHFRERADGAVKILHQGIDGRAQIEHQRGVDDVLAGRAPMHVAGGIGVAFHDFRGQRLDQRNGDVAGGDRRFARALRYRSVPPRRHRRSA